MSAQNQSQRSIRHRNGKQRQFIDPTRRHIGCHSVIRTTDYQHQHRLQDLLSKDKDWTEMTTRLNKSGANSRDDTRFNNSAMVLKEDIYQTALFVLPEIVPNPPSIIRSSLIIFIYFSHRDFASTCPRWRALTELYWPQKDCPCMRLRRAAAFGTTNGRIVESRLKQQWHHQREWQKSSDSYGSLCGEHVGRHARQFRWFRYFFVTDSEHWSTGDVWAYTRNRYKAQHFSSFGNWFEPNARRYPVTDENKMCGGRRLCDHRSVHNERRSTGDLSF